MKKVLFWVILIFVISLSIALWSSRASQDPVLAEKIETLLEQGETEIDLLTLTDFEWTHVSAFGPYTTKADIEDVMDITFKGNSGGIELSDDRFLLVFANETRALKTVVLSRKYGSYTIKQNTRLVVTQ